MLYRFSFANFKSFRDLTSIDFKAQKITEHSEHLINIGRDKILKVIAIFGANASGKSNVYKAFAYMSHFVINSFRFGGDDNEIEGKLKPPFPNFRFDDVSQKEPTLFEIIYSHPDDPTGKVYQYGFKIWEGTVREEWLKYKAKTRTTFKPILLRSENEVELFGSIKKWEENILLSLEKEVLAISLGAKLKIPKLKAVRDWFLTNEIVSFGDPVETFFRSRSIPPDFADSLEVQQDVADFLHTFDKSITGFNVEERPRNKDDDEQHFRIFSLHGQYSIPLEEESSGTLKMFELYPYLVDVMRKGSVLFVDELNEKLHPLVVRNLISTFLSDELNPNNAQLVFTSHDVFQLSKDVLRRDQILFVIKPENRVSSIKPLSDITDEHGVKIRKDENYEKNYLLGDYGAVPEIKKIKL